jgi:hypothetical protein
MHICIYKYASEAVPYWHKGLMPVNFLYIDIYIYNRSHAVPCWNKDLMPVNIISIYIIYKVLMPVNLIYIYIYI